MMIGWHKKAHIEEHTITKGAGYYYIQGYYLDLETGRPKLPIVIFWGILFSKGYYNTIHVHSYYNLKHPFTY